MENLLENLKRNLNEGKFDEKQIYQIQYGIESNLDDNVILTYAKPEFDYRQMEKLRLIAWDKCDISLIANPAYSPEQMSLLHRFAKKGGDISKLINPLVPIETMGVIYRYNGVDVSDLDLTVFDCDQLEEIIIGRDKGLNTTIYTDAKYSWKQMYQIRLGLMCGLDVSSYANPNISVEEMRSLRRYLTRKRNK